MDTVFALLVVSGLVAAMFTGNLAGVTSGALAAAGDAVLRMLQLVGILSLWLGVARVAQRSGLLELLARLLQPLLRPLFPSLPPRHPALAHIALNLTANVFGFGSAATPFGLKAMEELQKSNPRPDTASEAMCTFLAINTSSVTIIPATLIGLRAAAGAQDPADIVGAAVFATACSTLAALLADYAFRRRRGWW